MIEGKRNFYERKKNEGKEEIINQQKVSMPEYIILVAAYKCGFVWMN